MTFTVYLKKSFQSEQLFHVRCLHLFQIIPGIIPSHSPVVKNHLLLTWYIFRVKGIQDPRRGVSSQGKAVLTHKRWFAEQVSTASLVRMCQLHKSLTGKGVSHFKEDSGRKLSLLIIVFQQQGWENRPGTQTPEGCPATSSFSCKKQLFTSAPVKVTQAGMTPAQSP